MRAAPIVPGEGAPRGARTRAYAVHAYTAFGVALAFLAAAELCTPDPDPRKVFGLIVAAVLIDATDGPMARRWQVGRFAARIGGRTIDDIVDYLTFTFVPLLLVWRMGWLPDPAALWIIPALVASLFGFANEAAKDETGGFFLGFPSYWNVVAFYMGLFPAAYGGWLNAAIVLALAALTVIPVRFIYPNLAPHPWRAIVLGGAVLWTIALIAMLPSYPRANPLLLWGSLAYPAFYTILSAVLARRVRIARRHESTRERA
jgi:phosphatidylcholine synthase